MALAGLLVVGFSSVSLSATDAYALGKKTAKATIVNRSSATLRLDTNETRLYSRFGGNTFGNWFNTAHFTRAPMHVVKPGLVTTLKFTGYASEGLWGEIVYNDVSNPDQTVTVSAHMHEPPHGNWISAWGIASTGFVVDKSDVIYNPNYASTIFCIYDPGTPSPLPACTASH